MAYIEIIFPLIKLYSAQQNIQCTVTLSLQCYNNNQATK